MKERKEEIEKDSQREKWKTSGKILEKKKSRKKKEK